MHVLIYLSILALTISPLWFKTPKLARLQFYLLIVATIYGMIALTPRRAHNSAPLNSFPPLLIAFFSCSQSVSDIEFCSPSDTFHRRFGDTACLCRNDNALATLAFCYQTAYPHEISSFLSMCNKQYNASLTMQRFSLLLEMYYRKARNILENLLQTSNGAVDFPVKIPESTILLNKKSYDQFLGNYNRSIDYGWYIVCFWVIVFVFASLGNWSKVIVPNFVTKLTGPILRWSRSNVTLPALLGKERTNEKKLLKIFDYLPPTRAETLVVVAFSLLCFICCFIKIHYVPYDAIFDSSKSFYMRAFAVRSGILASSLLPLSVLFVGRNNVLQWITRWEYSVFVMFHRWLSRVMVLLLIVHSIGYISHVKLPLEKTKAYVLFGGLGTISGVAILVQGLFVLRRKWYECFLAIHIVLAVAFLAGAWLHVENLNFLWYYYVSACLWVFDRLVRIQRLCLFGFPKANVQLFEDNTLKFRVPVPAGFQAEGGGHCFVHFLHWSSFWQSHPFTYTLIDGDIVFYVKVKQGITDSLKTYLESYPSRSVNIRVAVEGSYGEATPAKKYDSSVFIAGGNGIPGIYAEALEVNSHNLGERRVKLIWVVREYPSILWFYEELHDLKGRGLEIEIYITRPETRPSSAVTDKLALLENTYTHRNYSTMQSMEDPIAKLHRDLQHVRFREGRPNIGKIVYLSVEESPGSVCFVTCGHPVMVDDIRHEVAQIVGTSEKRIDYFEQLQVWA